MARRRTAASHWASTAWWRLLAGEKSMREVIAFPKTTAAQDLMADAPSAVEHDQLEDLGIALIDAKSASLEITAKLTPMSVESCRAVFAYCRRLWPTASPRARWWSGPLRW